MSKNTKTTTKTKPKQQASKSQATTQQKKLTKKELQNYAFDNLDAIVKDPKTSSAVRVQALTQIARLAEQMQDVEPEKISKLSEFLGE